MTNSKVYHQPQVIVMIDTETFGLGVNSVVTHYAMVAIDLEDDDSVIREYYTALPMYPQTHLIEPKRTVDFGTIKFWMDQPEAAREIFEHPQLGSKEYEDLVSILRQICREFDRAIEGVPSRAWRVISKNTAFDIAMLNGLFSSLGMETPWARAHRQVIDLRSTMDDAMLDDADFARSKDNVAHNPLDDCRHQLNIWRKCQRVLAGGRNETDEAVEIATGTTTGNS